MNPWTTRMPGFSPLVDSAEPPDTAMSSQQTIGRRRWMLSAATSAGLLSIRQPAYSAGPEATAEALTVCTFGDSVLDCGHFNERGVTPGDLLVRNDDALFPEFKGHDLQSVAPTTLLHRAVNGATVNDLPEQARSGLPSGRAIALLTIGGNDLLRGLASDQGAGVTAFERKLEAFLVALPIRPIFIGTVYDPTFGDDRRNFLGVPASIARANHKRVNQTIKRLARRHGRLVDLHAHFLLGEPDWYTQTIEPSLRGASEVRRAFLSAICPACSP